MHVVATTIQLRATVALVWRGTDRGATGTVDWRSHVQRVCRVCTVNVCACIKMPPYKHVPSCEEAVRCVCDSFVGILGSTYVRTPDGTCSINDEGDIFAM